jgi:16S rRNA (adenine1518-N6/adenine1519-N6)-dimethyltransferase
MTYEPLSLAETRDLLTQLGHGPRHSLGQNFLIDANLVRKSVALGKLSPGDRVVEIGPGLGTLTRALLAAGAEVWAIERDATLANHLRSTLGHEKRFHLIEGDAVDHPLADLPLPEQGFKIIANLPYAISSAWMEAICLGPHPQRMVLMLQREAAERLTAEVGTKHWSALTIQVDLAFSRTGLHPVAPGCFHPAPKVESCLLVLDQRQDAQRLSKRARTVARAIFTQRRKQVGSAAKRLFPGDTGVEAWIHGLSQYGLNPTVRPEGIPSEAWLNFPETLP